MPDFFEIKLNKNKSMDEQPLTEASMQLLGPLLSDRPESEQQVLKKAANWAINAHLDQQRASGEPYSQSLCLPWLKSSMT